MDVVGHQHIGMNSTSATNRGLVNQFKVGLTVIIIEEARLAIVTTLRDVLWNSGNVEASWSWQSLIRD